MRTYQHSGAVPPAGAGIALLAGALAAVALGVAYSFTFYYIPYVYLNFLLATAFGAGTGWVVGLCAKTFNIRNTLAAGAIAVAAALAGIYAEWGSTVYAMYPAAELPQLWAKAGLTTFQPLSIVGVMRGLFAEGSWGLSENMTVHGWPLVGLWLVEAGLVVSLAFTAAKSVIADHPFCEACQRWVSGHTPHFYVGDGSEPVWTDVKLGTFETLALTPRATGGEPTFVRLNLKSCDGCSDSNFLTITACQNTTDSRGTPKLVENQLVSNLILKSSQAEIIEAANCIAPGPGETPVELPPDAGNHWTLREPEELAQETVAST